MNKRLEKKYLPCGTLLGITSVLFPALQSPAQATDGTFDGPVVFVDYGDVQVRLVVLNGKITDAIALKAPAGKSKSINDRAIPILRTRTLAAQSDAIQGVSGASYTSYGWYVSLQGALAAAHLPAPTPVVTATSTPTPTATPVATATPVPSTSTVAMTDLAAANIALSDARKLESTLQTQIQNLQMQFQTLADSLTLYKSQITYLNSQVTTLNKNAVALSVKLRKICAVKPKPKGC